MWVPFSSMRLASGSPSWLLNFSRSCQGRSLCLGRGRSGSEGLSGRLSVHLSSQPAHLPVCPPIPHSSGQHSIHPSIHPPIHLPTHLCPLPKATQAAPSGSWGQVTPRGQPHMGPPFAGRWGAGGEAGDASVHPSTHHPHSALTPGGASPASLRQGCHRHRCGDVGTSWPHGVPHPAVSLGKCWEPDARAGSHFSPPASPSPHPPALPAPRPFPLPQHTAGATGDPRGRPKPPEDPGTRLGTSLRTQPRGPACPKQGLPPGQTGPRLPGTLPAPGWAAPPGIPSAAQPQGAWHGDPPQQGEGCPQWGFLARVFFSGCREPQSCRGSQAGVTVVPRNLCSPIDDWRGRHDALGLFPVMLPGAGQEQAQHQRQCQHAAARHLHPLGAAEG